MKSPILGNTSTVDMGSEQNKKDNLNSDQTVMEERTASENDSPARNLRARPRAEEAVKVPRNTRRKSAQPAQVDSYEPEQPDVDQEAPVNTESEHAEQEPIVDSLTSENQVDNQQSRSRSNADSLPEPQNVPNGKFMKDWTPWEARTLLTHLATAPDWSGIEPVLRQLVKKDRSVSSVFSHSLTDSCLQRSLRALRSICLSSRPQTSQKARTAYTLVANESSRNVGFCRGQMR